MESKQTLAWSLGPCVCVKKHSPKPAFVDQHHILPLYRGGLDTPENKTPLCPATHQWVHFIFRQFESAGRTLDRKRAWPMHAYEIAVDGWVKMERRNFIGT